MDFFVQSVVCDYGVYYVTSSGEEKLVTICNSRHNALLVARILTYDSKIGCPIPRSHLEGGFYYG